ncbi:MAG: transposase family protein [Candidatus Omnitrophica bacterium]|nr:transposase family protein [Candidatus Omnitrophota bacterium]
MTYVPTQMGNMYLFVIEDIHDKEVVGSQMNIRCGAQQAIEVLRQALMKRFGRESAHGLELIVRVDRGCQFTAHDFAQFAISCGIKLEFCGVQTQMTSRTSRASSAATSGRKFTEINMRTFSRWSKDGKITWIGTTTCGRTGR